MEFIRAMRWCSVGLALLIAAPAYAENRALIAAVKASDTALVRTLLKQRADVNAPEPDGTTALHWAAVNGDAETAALLIQAGANAKAVNRYAAQPLQSACTASSAVIVELLLKAGAAVNAATPAGESALMTCARTGNVEALTRLLDAGADVNAKERWHGQTALMMAAARGHADAVKLLLTHGADLQVRSHEMGGAKEPRSGGRTTGGFTAFHFAVREGAIDAARVLLDAGARVADPAPDGTSPLVLAILNGHFELAALLLDRGADPNVPDAQHGSALHALEWVRRPVARSVGMGSSNIYPRIATGHMDSLTLAGKLLERGADPNVRIQMQDPKYTASPLGTPFYSVRNPPDIAISAVSVLNWGGATPFWVAAKNADVLFMRLLVAHGADPLLPNRINVTPLMAAAGAGFMQGEHPGTEAEALEATRLTIELGNDVNAAAAYPAGEDHADLRFDGMTALHGAALRGANSVVRLLLEHGARLDVKTREGWTAFNVADGVQVGCCYQNWPQTADLLRQLMAERGIPAQSIRYEQTAAGSQPR